MTTQEITNLPTDQFVDEWESAIILFKKRFQDRYFSQIEILQSHPKTKLTCGFLITSIDCILIETLEQFYEGEDEVRLTNRSYYNFFQRADELNGVFNDQADAGRFFGIVRSGLLHQAKTKQKSIINIRRSTPIIRWINPDDRNLGFEINRNLFHRCVINEYDVYIENLRKHENELLRRNFKSKMLTIF